MIAPFEAAQNGTIKVGAEVQPLLKLVQSEEWPRMMKRYLGIVNPEEISFLPLS